MEASCVCGKVLKFGSCIHCDSTLLPAAFAGYLKVIFYLAGPCACAKGPGSQADISNAPKGHGYKAMHAMEQNIRLSRRHLSNLTLSSPISELILRKTCRMTIPTMTPPPSYHLYQAVPQRTTKVPPHPLCRRTALAARRRRQSSRRMPSCLPSAPLEIKTKNCLSVRCFWEIVLTSTLRPALSSLCLPKQSRRRKVKRHLAQGLRSEIRALEFSSIYLTCLRLAPKATPLQPIPTPPL